MVGRHPEYKPEMCQEMIDMMAKGMLDVEIYAKWGISKNTFYRWIRENKEFSEAYEIGLPKCEAAFIGFLRKMATGKLEGKHSFTSIAMILNTKFKYAKVNSGSESQTINVNTVNVFNTEDRQETIQYIMDKLTKPNEIIEVKTDDYQLLESPRDPETKD